MVGMTTVPPAATGLSVVPLTRERLADLASLFDQGGDPKWCWCSSFRVPASGEFQRRPAENRALLEALTEHPPAPGLLAYRRGQAVGWVSLGPREGYVRLTASRVLAPIDARPVWSIVCFVVGRRMRGQGIAHALLAGAIDHARAHGATTLEAYPADTGGGRIPSAAANKGTLAMFQHAGFVIVARRRANRTTAERPIVQLEL
jgi:GNAT superfamily N-acetyltransferase